ncbi:MAG: hypothetical protein AB9883_06570 [Acidaminococcaceae bacterium]
MKGRSYLITVLALLALIISSLAFAASDTPTKYKGLSAIVAARAEVTAGANLLGYNKDGDDMSVVFQDPATLEYYYVEVVYATSKVKEVKINGAVFVLGSTVVNKTADDVKSVLLKTYPDAMNIVITTDHDMNNTYYQASFTTKKFKGEAKFNPATGVIIERTLVYY